MPVGTAGVGRIDMPIRFRCSNCNRLLGIARRKARATVACPHCHQPVVVPDPGPDDEEIPAPASTPPSREPLLPAANGEREPIPLPPRQDDRIGHPEHFPSPQPAPPIAKMLAPVPISRLPISPPLAVAVPVRKPSIFEQSNIDEILRSEPDSPVLIPQSADNDGRDSRSEIPENALVLSSSRATILSVLAALLMAIVFAVGVLVGRVIR